MSERRVVVGSTSGLHARPAALFVKEVNQLAIPVTIAKDEADPVDARSIMGVLGAGIGSGEQVVLATSAEGADAESSLDGLAAFLERDLDAAGDE